MASLTDIWRAHIRTTPKGVCGIVRSCTAHELPIVGLVQMENRKELHCPRPGEPRRATINRTKAALCEPDCRGVPLKTGDSSEMKGYLIR
jgi:hypothetical protein